MGIFSARLVDARPVEPAGPNPAYRLLLLIDRGEDPDEGVRREVVVEVPDELAAAFADAHPKWRGADWAAFFAVTRGEALEGLLEMDEETLELAEPPLLEDCRPPDDWTPMIWPPKVVRVERTETRPEDRPPWRLTLGRFFPALDERSAIRVPVVLTGASLGILLLAAVLRSGEAGVGIALLASGVYLAAMVGTGILACWVATRVGGVGFGDLKNALVKLSAVFLVPAALDVLLGGFTGLFFAMTAWCWLLAWFFDLDLVEIAITVVIVILVRLFLVGALVAAVLA
jgi:hypothetical protein